MANATPGFFRASISQRALRVNTTGTTVYDKTYDGNDIAVTTLSNSVDSFTEAQGIIDGETLNLSASGAFLAGAGAGAKDAHSNKTVEVTYTLVDGSGGKGKSSNYKLVDATPRGLQRKHWSSKIIRPERADWWHRGSHQRTMMAQSLPRRHLAMVKIH